jgi:hypothetical protein
MRLLELKSLISEAGLQSKDFISKLGRPDDRVPIFLKKVATGSPFRLEDGREVTVKKSEGKRLKELFDSGIFNATIDTDAGPVLLSKFSKTHEFGGQSVANPDPNVISNLGNISEGMLGAALFAKLGARVAGGIEQIGTADLWRVIDTLKKTKKTEYSMSVQDKSKRVVNDTIKYTLKLSEAPYSDLMNKEKRHLLARLADSCVAFANSPDADEYAEHFYLNGKPDNIHVVTDGISANTEKKTDVEVTVRDQITGEVSEKVLNLSLKAGAGQFGQAGGGSMQKGRQSPAEAANYLWSGLGIDVSPISEDYMEMWKEDPREAAKFMYTFAAGELNSFLAGDNDTKEYKFIKYVADFINNHATYRDPSVLLVDLEKGTYHVLSFANLEPKLAKIDFAARYRDDVKEAQIDIYDKNHPKADNISDRKSVLLTIRFKPQESSYKNLIFSGPILKQVADVTRSK